MFCKKCGAELPDNARFCHQCGTEIVLTSDADQSSDPQPQVPPTETEVPPPPPPPQGSQSAPSAGIVCPKCGSADLKIERFTWWGGIVGAALANRLSCRSCGHKFKINR